MHDLGNFYLTSNLLECDTLCMESQEVNSQQAIDSQNPKNKKLFIGAVVFIAIVVVFIFITIISESMSKKNTAMQDLSQQPPVNSRRGNLNNANQSSSPSAITNQTENWKDYKNSNFSLKYPPDWERVEDWPQGTLLVVQPTKTQTSTPSRVAVEINDASRVSVGSMSAGLSALHFKMQAGSIAGLPAKKFSGVINFPGKIIHNNAYLLEHNGKIYYIKLSYQQTGVDLKLEEQFGQIVSTFNFQ